MYLNPISNCPLPNFEHNWHFPNGPPKGAKLCEMLGIRPTTPLFQMQQFPNFNKMAVTLIFQLIPRQYPNIEQKHPSGPIE